MFEALVIFFIGFLGNVLANLASNWWVKLPSIKEKINILPQVRKWLADLLIERLEKLVKNLSVKKENVDLETQYTHKETKDEDAEAFNLGMMYYMGRGVETDKHKGLFWLRKAAEQGIARAQFLIGMMYFYGDAVEKDDREATRWLRLAAEQGLTEAQFNLGLMYDKGEVDKDKCEAARWYRLAAEQGDMKAQNNLGLMYNKGEGVDEDKQEGVRWTRLSAEQGHVRAQTNLGSMYYKGDGVDKDDREALRWYHLAAKQGDSEAQFNLGVVYKGEGVDKDYREAYIWFLIAKESGDKDVDKLLQDVTWQQELTPEEIESAKQEVKRRFEEIESRKKQLKQGKKMKPKKQPFQKKSICLTNLRLTLWERPDDNVKWGASIIDEQTKNVLVKVYAESEEKAITKAGYTLYTDYFHYKKFEQVEKSSIVSEEKNDD